MVSASGMPKPKKVESPRMTTRCSPWALGVSGIGARSPISSMVAVVSTLRRTPADSPQSRVGWPVMTTAGLSAPLHLGKLGLRVAARYSATPKNAMVVMVAKTMRRDLDMYPVY